MISTFDLLPYICLLNSLSSDAAYKAGIALAVYFLAECLRLVALGRKPLVYLETIFESVKVGGGYVRKEKKF